MAEPKPRDISPQTDNLVITCMDNRFHKTTREILLEDYEVNIDESDRLTLAGSSKAVDDGVLIPQIQKSHQLYDISNVWVIDETKEQEAHFESMTRAKEAIHKILPQLVVTTFLVNLDGEKVLPPDS
jgi:hypothetical protein